MTAMRTQADREVDWSTGRELERKDAEIERLRAVNAELLAALRTMVYETTHLSPLEDDGSHKCKISKAALEAARAAIAKATSLEPKGTET